MNRIEVEYVEDSSELDPRAPGVWTQSSFQLGELEPEPAPADADVVRVHVRDQRRSRRALRLRRALRAWGGQPSRLRAGADRLC